MKRLCWPSFGRKQPTMVVGVKGGRCPMRDNTFLLEEACGAMKRRCQASVDHRHPTMVVGLEGDLCRERTKITDRK